MLNLTKIKSASGAADYLLAVDDYYRECDLSPTAWEGELAHEMGLNGEVDSKQFTEMLNGKMPDGSQIGRADGKHTPGHDMTFSAPKSVSIVALVSGDTRLIEAHDNAVRAAIKHIEEHAAATRVNDGKTTKTVAVDGIAVATFRHASSREQDPQIHSHAVLLNVSKDENGQYRSIEARPLYVMQKEIDSVYQNELARQVKELGYEINTVKHGDVKSFEISSVSPELIANFSKRSDQIIEALKEKGHTRETASAEMRETASLDTRQEKAHVDSKDLRERWNAEALQLNQNPALSLRNGGEEHLAVTKQQSMDKAIEAVKMASEHLSERASRFTTRELEQQAVRFAGEIGTISKDEIRQAIELKKTDGLLIARQTEALDPRNGLRSMQQGFTTAEAIKTEQAMLDFANNAIAGNAKIITEKYDPRDILLAKSALENEKFLNLPKTFRKDMQSYLHEQHKKGNMRKEFDKSGRCYFIDKEGKAYAQTLFKNERTYESRNLQHLGLTKTKYVLTDNGTVLKQGGTLKSEFAGFAKEKINSLLDENRERKAILEKINSGEYTKTFTKATETEKAKLAGIDKNGKVHVLPDAKQAGFARKSAKFVVNKSLSKAENWRKAGAIESAIVINAIKDKEGKSQAFEREQLFKVSQGVKSQYKTNSGKEITTEKEALKAIAKTEKETGFAFNKSQKEATVGILTNKDRISLVQGYAGTAKTTSVLACTTAQLKEQGYEIKALAPTVEASKVLGDAIKAESMTMQKHISDCEKGKADMSVKQAWIVDEASLVSSKDMKRLLEQAEKAQAKVVLVGDVKQLGSVEKGAAFRQLQEQTNLKTYKLDEIVRQRDDKLKTAVYNTIEGDVKGALKIINEKGDLNEIKDRKDRVSAIAKEFTSSDMNKTLVVVQSKKDRDEVNHAIRNNLKADGKLTGEAITIKALESKDMTQVEKKLASSYEKGDLLKAGKANKELGLKEGEFIKVVDVNEKTNRLTIEKSNGEKHEIQAGRPATLSAYTEKPIEIQAGDKLTVKVKDEEKGLANGDKLTVTKVEKHEIHCKNSAGKDVVLDADKQKDLHVAHGYAMTAHEAQGKTCDKALILQEASKTNLSNQQSLYVGVSRAKDEAKVYTDDKEKLIKQVESHTGQKETAIEKDEPNKTQSIDEKNWKEKKELYVKEELARNGETPESADRQQKKDAEQEAVRRIDVEKYSEYLEKNKVTEKTVEKPFAEKSVETEKAVEKPIAEKAVETEKAVEKPIAEKAVETEKAVEKPVAEQ